MSFEELRPFQRQNAAPAKGPVRIGMSQIRDADPRLLILIDAAVLDLLGGKARRYQIGLGKADHRHLLRIEQRDNGPFEAMAMANPHNGGKRSGTFRFRLAPNERFPACKVPAQPASYEHDRIGKALLITLPSWAWDDKVKRDLEEAPFKRKDGG